MITLHEAAEAALSDARSAENGRRAELLIHDGPLRQTVIALRAGTVLAEHNSPPAASLHLLRGRVKVTGEEPTIISEGTLAVLTHYRHAVEAIEDSVFLLTTVTSVPGEESHSASARP